MKDIRIAGVLAVSEVELCWSVQLGEQLLLHDCHESAPASLTLEVQNEKV